jgi:hypothetical protein
MESIIRSVLLILFLFGHIAFSQTLEKDFGEINIFSVEDMKQILTHNFTFTNETTGVLKFGPILKSCGCTSLQLTKDTLNPKESTQIIMQIDLSKKAIRKDFDLDETSLIKIDNAPDALKLAMRAKVRMRGIPVSIDLGRLKDESFRVRRFISISPPPGLSYRIVDVNCTNPKVTTFFKRAWFSSIWRIHFEFNMSEMNCGANSFELHTVYDLDAKETAQTTIVRFEKIEKVLHPENISMGVADVKSGIISKTFELSPGYAGVKCIVKSISTNPQADLSCGCTRMEEDRIACVANFKIAPDAQPNKVYRGSIKIEFSDNNIRPLDIPVFLFLWDERR